MSVMRVIILHFIKYEVRRPSRWLSFGHQAVWGLSTSKWDHGSPVPWASFLPLFSLLRSYILDLESGSGQTDRQTTAINASGRGHVSNLKMQKKAST